ncbi:carboxy methyl transferase for protein phosphatase 2A [Blastocladiella emersonii ATCC 22665]|nr:carboxy methyl transferase for protein phosphatase 2A [Blastocladiella emersonii ATCC 22665]
MLADLHAGPASPDDAVRGTDDDAAVSRMSAVETGYLVDPYALAFVRGASGHAGFRRPPGGAAFPVPQTHGHRRSPLINRGTYARITAFDGVLAAFTAAAVEGEVVQVLSLGAGTDTRFFRFKESAPNAVWREPGRIKYFEVDFAETVMKKIGAMRKHRGIQAILPGVKFDAKTTTYANDEYALFAGDLRDWDAVVARLATLGFDASRPTLVMAECVLVYVDPANRVTSLLSWLAANLADVAVARYDHIGPDDAFGRMMVHNLRERGVELPGLHAVPSAAAHADRLTEAGFKRAEAWDMNRVWRDAVPAEEKERIAKLEMLDEVEELQLLLAHYCFSVGAKGPRGTAVVYAVMSNPATA